MAFIDRAICPACNQRLSRRRMWRWGRDRCEHCGVGVRRNQNHDAWFIVIATVPTVLLLDRGWWQGVAGAVLSVGCLVILEPYVMRYERTTEGRQCGGCGYDLNRVASDRCPECGHATHVSP